MKILSYMPAILLISANVKGQIGINTVSPQATLQVVGKPSDPAVHDGIIPPRIIGSLLRTKNDVYGLEQDGTIIYVTEADSQAEDKTVYVTSPGYYFYDAPNSVWIKMAKDNEVAHDRIVFGNTPSAGINVFNWEQQYYTGGSITLTPGKWSIQYGSYMAMGTVSNGSWSAYPVSKVIGPNASAWCACSLSSTSNTYTAVDASTGLVNGSGRGGAGSMAQGERSTVSQGFVLVEISQSRSYYLFVTCNNYGASLGTDRPGNIFGPAWERWFFAIPF